MGHLTQTHYKQFHHDVFDADGEFVQEKWDAWDGPSMELCSMAMTKFNFSLAIVFLWSGRMLGELRNIDRLHRDIYAIQGLGEDSDISDMVKDVEGDEGEATGSRVVALTTVARVSTYVLIIIPKVLPDFKHDIHQHCHGSFDRNYEPICAMWQRGNCFPYGDGE